MLAVTMFITGQQHRRALRQQQRCQQRMDAGATSLDDVLTAA
jgi:hypothetical protein